MGAPLADRGDGRQTGSVPTSGSAVTRAAFESSVAGFLHTVASIGPGQWALPGSDEWTVRELAAHVVRGMVVISDLLDSGAPVPESLLPDAATYFRSAFALEDIHAGIRQRAVTAAAEAPVDIVAWAREAAATALARVASTGNDEVVVHFAGSLRFVDYLGTRVTELVLHTFELQVACGLELDAPGDALALVNGILLALADRADPIALALALSGRPGPTVCNVLA